MNDDYLWDRTGESDHEFKQLEDVLGTLRYQPRPLELPAQVRIDHRRTFLPRIAIAAAIAAMLVSGATWLLVQRPNPPLHSAVASNVPAVESLRTPPETGVTPSKDRIADSKIVNEALDKKLNQSGISKRLPTGNKQIRRFKSKRTELTAKDRTEAQAAKEQLLLALRVASAKLSLAQKKAQGSYPGNLIRNQHKVG
jgi:hypothetical protein